MHATSNLITERKIVMGMAASQARFLGLTARKSNVEYEGQQINQQRVMLSNESANYYNDLLGMSVPVPPAVADYTKTVYSFTDGALTNSISSMIAKPNGEYLISYTANWTDDFAAVSAPTSVVTRLLDSTQYSAKSNNNAVQDGLLKRLGVGSYSYNGMPLSLTTKFDVDVNIPAELKKAGMTAGIYYTYEEETPSGKTTHYISKDDIEGTTQKLSYNIKTAGQTDKVQSSGIAPSFTYSYGSNVLTAVEFQDTDEYPTKPEGLPAGRYYMYTVDGETHYFDREAVELQNVRRAYEYSMVDDNGKEQNLDVRTYNSSDLPMEEVTAIDIDNNELVTNKEYFRYTDENNQVHYVPVEGNEDAFDTVQDDNGNDIIVGYVDENTKRHIPGEVVKFDSDDVIPTRTVTAKDANGNEMEAGKEYAAFIPDATKPDEIKYILTSDIRENNVPAGTTFKTAQYYAYGSEKMNVITADMNHDAGYYIGDHYFSAAKVAGNFYDAEGKYVGNNLQAAHYIDDGKAKVNSSISEYTYTGNYQYNVGAKTFRILGSELDGTELKDTDEYYKTLSEDQIKQLLLEEKEYIAILNKQYGDDSEWMVRYVQNTSSNTWQPMFTKLNKLGSTIYSDTGSSLSYVPMYTVGSAEKNEEVKNVLARFEQDATGRLINVTLHPGEEDQVTYAVTTNTITDQAKYDDAMNQYEYDKAKYDQAIQEINAKIAIIQNEDKNLELRLKQLDTEQDAIQTEMDAVQKVIEKNTESTFKTFG